MDMFDLTGRVALITGGNGGIGLGIAQGLAEAGAAVCLAARNEDKSRAAVEGLTRGGSRAMAVTCDVNDPSSVADAINATVGELGGLDILVNNAGTNRRANEPQELSMEDWRLVVDTNLTSLHIVSTAAFPHLKASTGGKVINIGSMMSVLATGYAPAYAASKGGVVQYSKSLAVGWGRYNIQVNCILPGWVHTDMTAAFLEMFPERRQVIVDRTPAGRWADPGDLAGTAVFLASRASDFVTGASIPVDGGYLVQ